MIMNIFGYIFDTEFIDAIFLLINQLYKCLYNWFTSINNVLIVIILFQQNFELVKLL